MQLQILRTIMQEHNLSALVLRDIDPHQSELPAPHFSARSWASGFTGSAGSLIVTATDASLWTDSRYFIEAETMFRDTAIEFCPSYNEYDEEMFNWIHARLSSDAKVDSVPRIALYYPSIRMAEVWQEHYPHCTIVEAAPYIDALWVDRAERPSSSIFSYSEYSHQSRTEKLAALRASMAEHGATQHLVSTLGDIAWILNLRGADLACSPLFYAHLLVTEQDAILCINPLAMHDDLADELRAAAIFCRDYDDIEILLAELPAGSSILLDPHRITYHLGSLVPSQKIFAGQPSIQAKSIKVAQELPRLQTVYRQEGCVWVHLLHWLSQSENSAELSESAIAEKITALRAEQNDYIFDSFDSIVAFREHSAMPHYRTISGHDVPINRDGVLLIDSGGHYLGGTTDITRTLYLGDDVPEDVAASYTQVLKAHIALACASFPSGTSGIQLDAIARNPLWRLHKNYGHGTGHGIGTFLDVHEYPPAISPHAGYDHLLSSVRPGMVLSNEPGLYYSDYGIRIENVLHVIEDRKNDFGEFFTFELLSLCPLDKRLILPELCTPEELSWINWYQEWVYAELTELLPRHLSDWLASETVPIVYGQ